jgi:hypothetical protein
MKEGSLAERRKRSYHLKGDDAHMRGGKCTSKILRNKGFEKKNAFSLHHTPS